MARNGKNNIRPGGRVMSILMDGKKTVLASGLVLVMAFMWVRVLTGNKPSSAAAAPAPRQTEPVVQRVIAKVKLVELPKIPGRNDSIYKDCFNMQNRACFRQVADVQRTSADTEVLIVPPNRDQEVIQQVAQTLKLGAVLRNPSPQAFVNDRFLAVGDTFTVEHSAGPLEFEVLQIHEDSVLVECHGIQLTLKLASMEVRK